ncbi:MAG: undecaprenyl-diphosphate phosphatase [bacterium]
MSIWKAAALGVVQGLTEFLPVSSSGHLVIVQKLLGVGGASILFDTFVHLGTLLAVVLAFWEDILDIFQSSLSGLRDVRTFLESPSRVLLLMVIVGTIPTAIMGVLFKDVFEAMFSDVRAVGLSLLATGFLLFSTRFARAGSRRVGFWDAIAVGIAQGIAIVPGVSRSGFTISAGIWLGVEREKAARFSFLLSIPAILGAFVLQLGDISWRGGNAVPHVVGMVVAAATGYLAIRLLLGWVRRGKLHLFAIYCWALGAVGIALGWTAQMK